MNQWRVKRRRHKKMGIGFKLVLLFALIAVIILVAEARLAPIIEAQALSRTHNLVLARMSEAISRQVALNGEAGNYQSLMNIERDDQGKIVLMAADVALVNSFVSALVLDIKESLNLLDEQELNIPLFAVTGSKLFASLGPELPIRIIAIATPSAALSDSFVSAGINQVKHSIYLDAETTVQIAVPFGSEVCTVSTRVLLAEGIIIGDIPETFVQFDTSNIK